MCIRPLLVRVVGVALVSVALLSTGALLIEAAQAQSAQPSPLERARTAVENLINHLRGRDLPDGIVKSNGRLEATEVDVAAKYPGRLVELTVNEGDEVTAGQVVGKISSPETEAQLAGAQAQVLKAKQSLAEAEANIVQRNSDLVFTRTDFERAKRLLQSGNIPEQVHDQRRSRFEMAELELGKFTWGASVTFSRRSASRATRMTCDGCGWEVPPRVPCIPAAAPPLSSVWGSSSAEK